MRRINIMSGLPGSGKTTFIAEKAKEGDLCLHRDLFRDQLRKERNSDKYFPVPATEEWKLWTDLINTALINLYDTPIWIDQTTIGAGALTKLLNALALTANDSVFVHILDYPYETILTQNANEGRVVVPQATMDNMLKTWKNNPITIATIDRLELPCSGSIVIYH